MLSRQDKTSTQDGGTYRSLYNVEITTTSMTRESLLRHVLLLLLLRLCLGCNPRCTFSRCRNGQAFKPRLIGDQSSPFLLRAQEKRWLPYICRRVTTYPLRIHSIKTRQPLVRPMSKPNSRFVKISKYSPRGITKPFSRRYFHLQKFREGEWVIVRQRTRGNQEKFLHDLCVTIPVKGYRYLTSSGKPKGKWRKGGRGDCISFRTRTVKMLIELRWNSRDDLDLSVEEPDGRIASRFKQHESCGRLSADAGSRRGVCSNIPDKSESIRYFGCLPKGRFIIRVGHFRNCGRGSKYEVRVTHFGRLVYTKVGESNAKSGKEIEEIALDFK